MDLYIGFDVAKAKLDYSIINTQGIELEHGVIKNKSLAIINLLKATVSHYSGCNITGVVEASGGYQDTLTGASHSLGIDCLVFNPLITKQQIKTTVRGKKTDRTDAFIIARVGWSGGGRLYTPDTHKAVKHLARGGQKLSVLSGSLKRYSSHIINELGDDMSSQSKELLNGIQSSILVARKQFNKDLALSAKSNDYRLLQTIPGIGPYLAASIIGEIQDIRRFDSTKSLIAYAGLDPRIRQSGHALNNTGKLTKRGSSYLRRSMFIAASIARRYDPQFEALYNKKRAEGKSYTVAVCVVARKLIAVLRSVLLSGNDYVVPR